MNRVLHVFAVSLLLILSGVQTGNARTTDSLTSKQRQILVGTISGVGYTGVMVGLSQAWYSNYARSDFHWINDNKGWLQIDKAGHILGSYAYGIYGIEVMKWTGIKKRNAIIIGGLAGTIFQTPIEILDGFSRDWGASAGDLIANSTGSLLAISQGLLWDEQRIQMKMSYWPSRYQDVRPNVLGSNPLTGFVKDYNAQTYWLSTSPGAFIKDSFWPKWLQVSVGYGADGMLGANSNVWEDGTGRIQDYSHIPRVREYYLSLDIDLSQIKTRSQFLNTFLSMVNLFKFPAPAIRWSPGSKPRYYGLYF